MKILTIIGTRPQFIKASLISDVLAKDSDIEEILIHTGQHYDQNMSEQFFTELSLPQPKYNLSIGNQNSNKMIGQMMIQLDTIYRKEKPHAVLVYGDCSTTLAGALTAKNLDIPIIHVEAGARSGDFTMPEENNRILVDHMATLLLCPTVEAVKNLKKDGIVNDKASNRKIYVIGDPMIQLLRNKCELIRTTFPEVLNRYNLKSKRYYVLTLHRKSNTEPGLLKHILLQLKDLCKTIIWPVHPRTKAVYDTFDIDFVKQINEKIMMIEPQSYLVMMALISQSYQVITDSGGLQKEAYLFTKPCTTLRTTTEWGELVKTGWNQLIDPKSDNLVEQITGFRPNPLYYKPFFEETTSELVLKYIKELKLI